MFYKVVKRNLSYKTSCVYNTELSRIIFVLVNIKLIKQCIYMYSHFFQVNHKTASENPSSVCRAQRSMLDICNYNGLFYSSLR